VLCKVQCGTSWGVKSCKVFCFAPSEGTLADRFAVLLNLLHVAERIQAVGLLTAIFYILRCADKCTRTSATCSRFA
jgi:hypothetical protein